MSIGHESDHKFVNSSGYNIIQTNCTDLNQFLCMYTSLPHATKQGIAIGIPGVFCYYRQTLVTYPISDSYAARKYNVTHVAARHMHRSSPSFVGAHATCCRPLHAPIRSSCCRRAKLAKGHLFSMSHLQSTTTRRVSMYNMHQRRVGRTPRYRRVTLPAIPLPSYLPTSRRSRVRYVISSRGTVDAGAADAVNGAAAASATRYPSSCCW